MRNKRKHVLPDITIDKIEAKNQEKHPPPPHPVLPEHAFSMLIVAPKGSGKTNFICNLILKHYKQYFHRILVCSPTVNNDEKWDIVKKTKRILIENKKLEEALKNQKKKQKIKKIVFHNAGEMMKYNADKDDNDFDGIIPEMDFFHDLDEIPSRIAEQNDIIEKLHKLGYEDKSKFIADRMLVILDDQAGKFKGGTNNPMVNFVIRHRHASASVIVVTQAYKQIPKAIRTNCNVLILFEIPSLSERKVIYEDNPQGLEEDEWTQVYKHVMSDKFSFMYTNWKFPPGQRVYKRFEKMIILDNNDEENSESEDDDDQPPKKRKLNK